MDDVRHISESIDKHNSVRCELSFFSYSYKSQEGEVFAIVFVWNKEEK